MTPVVIHRLPITREDVRTAAAAVRYVIPLPDGEALARRLDALLELPPEVLVATDVRREPRAFEIVEHGAAITPADKLPPDVCRRCRLGKWAHVQILGDPVVRCADREPGQFGEVTP